MNELPELTINCRGAGANEARFKITGVGVARIELQYPAAKYSGALDLKAIAAIHEWTGQFLAMHEALREVKSGKPDLVSVIYDAINARVGDDL